MDIITPGILKIILITITLVMLILRMLAVGWYLILFGGIFFLISSLQVFAGWQFINQMSFPSPQIMDLLLFFFMNLLYVLFYLVQTDFGDTSESIVVVLQFITGKNRWTSYISENHWSLSLKLGIPLILLQGLAIFLVYWR